MFDSSPIASFSMKVTRLTPVRLVLKETLLGLKILSFLTTLTGFYIFISFETPVDLFGGFCIAIASLINVMSPTEVCTFDKTIDRVTLHRLRGLNTTIFQCRLSEVSDVAIEQNNILGTQFYRLHLCMHSGNQIAITQSISTDIDIQTQLAKDISTFLYRPEAKLEINI